MDKSYQDELLCDVLPIDACHVSFGETVAL